MVRGGYISALPDWSSSSLPAQPIELTLRCLSHHNGYLHQMPVMSVVGGNGSVGLQAGREDFLTQNSADADSHYGAEICPAPLQI